MTDELRSVRSVATRANATELPVPTKAKLESRSLLCIMPFLSDPKASVLPRHLSLGVATSLFSRLLDSSRADDDTFAQALFDIVGQNVV